MTIAINLANPGAIYDYTTLVNNIRLWLDRGSDLDAYIPTFISLAEAYLNRELRTPEMEATIPVSLTGSTYVLPLDFLAMRGMTANGRPLQAMSPELLADTYGALPGCPLAFAMSGRTITLAPNPVNAATPPTVNLSYWQRIPGLSAGTPSNWLITSHPDVYLFGALAHAQGYIDAPDDLARWTKAFEATVSSISVAGNKQRWGGPITMRSGVRQVLGVRA